MKASRAVFLVHSWLGLKFFLILTVVTLSGTLAVFQHEIDWLIYSQMRVTPGPDRVGFNEIVAAVHEAHPDSGIVAEIGIRGAGPRSAVGVVAVSAAAGVRRIWVDPYRGRVQGTTPLLTPGYFLAQLHAYLLIPTWGYVIVCSFAFFLLASIVTGLMTYKKFWRGFFRVPRTRSLRTLMGDLHRLGGLWSLWFIVIMVLTSLWYFWIFVGEPLLNFPKAVHHVDHPMLSDTELDRLGPATPKRLPFDVLAETVRREFPDFDIRFLSLPRTHEAPLTFSGNQGELFVPNLSEVHVNPFTGAIVGHELTRDGWSSGYVDALIDAFHYGHFADLVSKAIWFLFGLVMTGLSITGLVIFSRRALRKAEAGKAEAGAAGGPLRRSKWSMLKWPVLRPWGGGMGWFKPVNLIVLALSAYASVMAVRFYGGGAAAFPARFEPQAIGPWRLGAMAIAGLGDTSNPIRPNGRATIVIQYCPDCWNSVKRLWVSVGGTRGDGDGIRVAGQPGYATATLRLPQQLGSKTRLWMTAEAWDGTKYQVSWPVIATATTDP